MAHNYGNHGSRYCVWRAWCRGCLRHLALLGRHAEWPDEIQCPLCGEWRKCVAKGKSHLAGDVLCPKGSGRRRVEEE